MKIWKVAGNSSRKKERRRWKRKLESCFKEEKNKNLEHEERKEVKQTERTKIKEDTFAYACYEQNTIEGLLDGLLERKADETDCEEWGITATEWRRSIVEALRMKIQDLRDRVYDYEYEKER